MELDYKRGRERASQSTVFIKVGVAIRNVLLAERGGFEPPVEVLAPTTV
jgi:hypothetical protein